MPANTPLAPSLSLLCKLGSLAVHADELTGIGHTFDLEAIKSLMSDPEVKAWIKAMGPFLPVKRHG